jgi:hypothetical protein
MSSARSAVLGKDVTSGSIGRDKIDSATGMPIFAFKIFSKKVDLGCCVL